jgi:hypothetical protein
MRPNNNDVEQAKPLPSATTTTTTSTTISTVHDRHIQTLLGQGAYHLPNNTKWWQDLIQYIQNNHPIFALCCQSSLHPISKPMRAVGLLGSIMIGLIITNIIFMWQRYYGSNQDDNDDNDTTTVLELSTGGYAIYNGTSLSFVDDDNVASQFLPQLEFSSTAMIVLWTAGSIIHYFFDSFLWYVSSCQCFDTKQHHQQQQQQQQNHDPSKIRKYCNILIIMLVILLSTVGTLAVVIRAMLEDSSTSGQDNNIDAILGGSTMVEDGQEDQTEWQQQLLQEDTTITPLTNKDNYRFLQAYTIELVMAWFFWFFVIELILFFGILSCGGRFLPSILGGRPYEIQQEQKEQQKQRHSQANKNKNTTRTTTRTTTGVGLQNGKMMTGHSKPSKKGVQGRPSSQETRNSDITTKKTTSQQTNGKKISSGRSHNNKSSVIKKR